MPRPIRFLATWFAGLLLSTFLLPLVATLQAGRPAVWRALLGWLGSGPFWSAVWLLALLAAAALLLGLIAGRAGLPGALAGLLGGAVSAIGYLLFYSSSSALPRSELLAHLGSGALLFAGALALAGALMGWFWQRAR